MKNILKELLPRLLGNDIQMIFMDRLPEYNQVFGNVELIHGYTYDKRNGLKSLPNDSDGRLNMKVVDGNTDYLIIEKLKVCKIYHLNGSLRIIRKKFKAIAI